MQTTSHEQRINSLERQNRRMKWLVASIALLATTGAIIGQTARPQIPQVIQARSFEVVNEQGEKLITLGSYRFGGLLVTRSHEGDKLCVMGGTGRGDGTITTYSGEVKRGVVLLTGDEHGGFVSVMSNAGTMAAGIGVDEKHAGIVTVRDVQGGHRALWARGKR
jgi:hypothetical protein